MCWSVKTNYQLPAFFIFFYKINTRWKLRNLFQLFSFLFMFNQALVPVFPIFSQFDPSRSFVSNSPTWTSFCSSSLVTSFFRPFACSVYILEISFGKLPSVFLLPEKTAPEILYFDLRQCVHPQNLQGCLSFAGNPRSECGSLHTPSLLASTNVLFQRSLKSYLEWSQKFLESNFKEIQMQNFCTIISNGLKAGLWGKRSQV